MIITTGGGNLVTEGGSRYQRHVPGVSSVGLQQAVSGTYQTEQISASGLDWTAGTETEVTEIAANCLANTASKDELISWLRVNIITADTAQATAGEWFLLRCLIADGLQDMDSEDIVEALQKDGRILERGWWSASQAAYGKFGKISFEKHKVKLRYGEELRLVILPIYVGAAQFTYGRMEWRIQGK